MPTKILDFSKPHVLRSAREYEAAVAELDALLDGEHLSRAEEDRLEFLTLLVEAYDEAHYPMGARSTPQSVVDFLLEQNGMTRAELAPLFGGRSRVSDFFAGKRRLSLGQIQALRDRFGVSADVLLPDEPAPAWKPARQNVQRVAERAKPRTGRRNKPKSL